MISAKGVRALGWIIGALLLTALCGGAWWIHASRPPAIPTIAFIPQTAGGMLWEVGHLGATAAADKVKCRLYWNAPTSESDVAGQVSLIDRVRRGRYQGLVLAPNHPFAILAPLRRVLEAGFPVVIVSAPLDLPPGGKLGYLVNDDRKMGELAAAEVARLIHGQGSIALAGLGRYAPGVMRRVRGAEDFFASRFPQIQVVSRLPGAYNSSRTEELTGGALDSNPGLMAVLSFTAASTRGVHAALKSRSLQDSVRLVGCEQDSDLVAQVGSGEIAAVLAEDTYRMGYEAVELLSASLAGKPMPRESLIPPRLITKENAGSAGAGFLLSSAR